jgi:hypothetical protein
MTTRSKRVLIVQVVEIIVIIHNCIVFQLWQQAAYLTSEKANIQAGKQAYK